MACAALGCEAAARRPPLLYPAPPLAAAWRQLLGQSPPVRLPGRAGERRGGRDGALPCLLASQGRPPRPPASCRPPGCPGPASARPGEGFARGLPAAPRCRTSAKAAAPPRRGPAVAPWRVGGEPRSGPRSARGRRNRPCPSVPVIAPLAVPPVGPQVSRGGLAGSVRVRPSRQLLAAAVPPAGRERAGVGRGARGSVQGLPKSPLLPSAVRAPGRFLCPQVTSLFSAQLGSSSCSSNVSSALQFRSGRE